jgi:hypothetical protein
MYLRRVIQSAARELRDVARGATRTHEHLRDRIAATVIITIAVDLLCALLALLFEHGAKQTQITDYGTALFWTSTQLLTVSSSITNPISTPGQILDVLMEIYAISVVAGLAGSVGAFMVRRGAEMDREAEAASPRAPAGGGSAATQ